MITPKVGPHQTYGFAPGKIYGATASLVLRNGMLSTKNSYLDYFAALDEKNQKIYFMLLNNDDENLNTTIDLVLNNIVNGATFKSAAWLNQQGKSMVSIVHQDRIPVQMAPYGIKVMEIRYSLKN